MKLPRWNKINKSPNFSFNKFAIIQWNWIGKSFKWCSRSENDTNYCHLNKKSWVEKGRRQCTVKRNLDIIFFLARRLLEAGVGKRKIILSDAGVTCKQCYWKTSCDRHNLKRCVTVGIVQKFVNILNMIKEILSVPDHFSKSIKSAESIFHENGKSGSRKFPFPVVVTAFANEPWQSFPLEIYSLQTSSTKELFIGL